MRLISFLGTSNYGKTSYEFEGKSCCTHYVAQALASLIQPDEIRLIATDEAWEQHGRALTKSLTESGHPEPARIGVPTAGDSDSLWRMFGVIVDAIGTSSQPVLLDITHGFRMQPFFAAACIQYVQAVLPQPPSIRVVYAEYRGEKDVSLIWELTTFLDVLSWSRSLMIFLQTGQADSVVEPTKQLARDLRKQWAESGKHGTQPQLQKLSNALQEFGNDLTTVRTGSLLLGERGSARQLAVAVDETREEVKHHLPALALVLDQMTAMVAPLRGDARLSAPTGQRMLLALARLYQGMGRYSEAISILREGWVTLGAPVGTDEPGSKDFDLDARKTSENHWGTSVKQAKSVAEIRNDIQHAGFQKRPLTKNTFHNQLTTLLNAWEGAIKSMPES